MKITHIITGLGAGGAETMLLKLLSGLNRVQYNPTVVSLTDLGVVGQRLCEMNIPVHTLNMRPGLPDPFALMKLVSLLRKLQPDLVQTWMYHADLLGGMATRLAGRVPVIWGIRHSNLDPMVNKRSTIWVARLCARLSRRLPERIVCCSEQAYRVHANLGYAEGRMLVIPNGFDLDSFFPDADAVRSVRLELGLPEGTPMIGLIARFHPQKDHHNFVTAAGMLHTRFPEVHFLLCGNGVDRSNSLLSGWISEVGLDENIHLLGLRKDIPRLTSALDIATSSSLGEGFPNVLGEAMACGVPCVATDVGDSAMILGQTGQIVPPADAQQLAAAWSRLLEIGEERRKALGRAARIRVEQNFSLPAISTRYTSLYDEVMSPCVA